MKKELVRLRERPSRDGQRFMYTLDYVDESGRRQRVSLGHADLRKAEKERSQRERELGMGCVEPQTMALSAFLQDCLRRTRGQVRKSTLVQHDIAMRHFIEAVGDIDLRKVKHEHGERFAQARLDKGNSPGTVNKKLRSLRRMFQLATDRGQIEQNPLTRLRPLKNPRRRINVFDEEQCGRILRAARQMCQKADLDWELLILSALSTAMRRGELLNATWRDIDFAKQTVEVAPKSDTEHTWPWFVKDTDRRTLPLTDVLVARLIERHSAQPEGYPYVFVPTWRYDRIQKIRQQGKWTEEHGKCPVNNFARQWEQILSWASIDHGEFHDLRRTCLTTWLLHGLSEYEVMCLAGHADFQTTHRFYLAVREDHLKRARAVTTQVMASHFGTHLARAHDSGELGLTGRTGRRYDCGT